MERAQQPDVAERVADLALAEPYARALLTVRGYAVGYWTPVTPARRSTRISGVREASWRGEARQMKPKRPSSMSWISLSASLPAS